MRRSLAVVVAVGTAAVAVLPATAAQHRAGRAGCAGRPAVVAHHAGGRVLHPQPERLPRACGVSTGFAGAESHLVARPDGTIVFTPAVRPHGLLGTGTVPVPVGDTTQLNTSPAAMAVTDDDGATWRAVAPDGVTWNPTDHSEYVEPVTGRLFFEDYGPIPLAPKLGPQQEGPAHISWTDDLRTWHHSVVSGVTLPENPRFTSARAPRGQPRPHGFPRVLYFCTNTNVGFNSPVIAGRLCFRSLDGGTAWTPRSVLLTGLTPQHPECGNNGEIYSAADGYYPQPAPDGRLYVMVACGGKTYLARSDDEAGSFPILHAQGHPVTLPLPTPGSDIGGTPELRIGTDGTFVLVYQLGQHVVVRVSHNRGITWTGPIDLTAPGVTAISQWALAFRGRSDIAVSYLGHRRGQHTWDGYLTYSRDVARALRRPGGPVFLSGQVNLPGRPLLYGDSIQGSGYLTLPDGSHTASPPFINNQSTGNEFIGAVIAPDGTPWGSFTEDCGPTPDSRGCRRQHDQTRGYAGRLTYS